MNADTVVITGIGAISPLGNSPAEIADRFCSGESAIRQITSDSGEPAFGALLDDIPLKSLPAESQTRVGRLDRLCRLFLGATYQAIDDARLSRTGSDGARVGLCFGTGYGCLLTNAEYYEKVIAQGPAAASPRLFAYTVSSAAAGEVSIALGIKGPNVTTHAGFAAGLQAIGYGVDLLRSGKADCIVAGGGDALGPALLRGLADMRLLKSPGSARPFADALAGIYPSEGAAVVVLEREADARRRGATLLARIAGWAAGFEPTLTKKEPEPDGILATLRRANADSARVDFVLASAHATAIDQTERLALESAFGESILFAPKSAWGECAAASGVLGVALATQLLRAPRSLADGLAWSAAGVAIDGDEVTHRLQSASLAAVHGLCYSGPTIALLLAR
ncbi:MAG TPA: beta-ketoacyl synthase N-terminal-like domain-containing protein [Candidatus Acidoferrales bacterium]|nr:beta-ketoacyl synthase N-terminal-like domain-containing protein [Candidatus Acidoferrales bacterium]